MTPQTRTKSDPTNEAMARDTVQEFFRLFAESWKTNDGAAVASFFIEAGSLIHPFGQRADGRTAIAAMYSEYFRRRAPYTFPVIPA
jgi:uncharacterized protein (TIGR02246 family)